MLARGNGDGAERVARAKEKGQNEESDNTLDGKTGTKSREERDSCHWWGWGASRRAWLKRGPRRRRQRPRPCCIYHIITIIELRAALRHCRPIPPMHPAFSSGHNRKLETLEYIFPSSLTHSLARSLVRSLAALEIVRRRTSAVESEGC